MSKITLLDWFNNTGIKKSFVAKAIGVSNSRITRLINGAKPYDKEMQKIIELTKGEVDANSFYGIQK